MKNIIGLDGIVVIAIFLYAVNYLFAKIMVKKRILLAKRRVIGEETPEKIELMKNVAKEILNMKTIDFELLKKEYCTVNVTVNCGEVAEVNVANDFVEVCVCDDGTESVENIALDEKETAIAIAFKLTVIMLIIIACLALI